jgi:glycyl-tRNA synthetase beta chain
LLKKLAALVRICRWFPASRREMDGKAEALFLEAVVPGVSLAEGLQRQ